MGAISHLWVPLSMYAKLTSKISQHSNSDLCLCLHRKTALSCTTCSNNLLSCCKSLWGLCFLQQHPEGPSEEQLGEPLSEGTERTPSQEGMGVLACEAV